MPRADEPARGATAAGEVGALVRAGPLRRDDPRPVPQEDQVTAARDDRHRHPVAGEVDGADADPDRPSRLSRRDRRTGHADRR